MASGVAVTTDRSTFLLSQRSTVKSCNIKTWGTGYGLFKVLSYRVSEQCSLTVSAQAGEEIVMPRIKFATTIANLPTKPSQIYSIFRSASHPDLFADVLCARSQYSRCNGIHHGFTTEVNDWCAG
jgi:hypothetical protein